MSSQVDVIVEVLSEKMAGLKLKRMKITHTDDSNSCPDISEVRLVFEGRENEEKIAIVWGKDLRVGFGSEVIRGAIK